MRAEPNSRKIFCGAALILALAGCGASDTAVQLVLAPDPTLNSISQVATQLARVQVVVDAEPGLSGPTETGATARGGTAVDWDGDGDLEVVFTSPPLRDDTLPVLEIGLTHNTGRELFFRVFGFADETTLTPEAAVALGGASGRCRAGNVCRIGTPFNLLARARPPQVMLVVPPDGSTNVPPNLPYLTVVFSTTVVAETVPAAVQLNGQGGHRPPTTAVLEDVIQGSATESQERRSLLQLQIGEPLLDNHYVLTVGPGIAGTNGFRFDQSADVPGENSFTSQFGYTEGTYGCPDGYTPDPTWGDACAPILDCAGGCAPGFVCNEATGQCREDCRLHGGCFGPDARCATDTGLCE